MDKDYKTIIRIDGDASGAEKAAKKAATAVSGIGKAAQQTNGFFLRMLASLNALRTVIGGLMRSLGVFYLAYQGFNLLIKGFTALKEKVDEFHYAASRARMAGEYNSAAEATDRLVKSQGRLNDRLKDELGLLAKRKALRELEEGGEAGFADEATRIRRAVELAGETDPNKRQLLQDRYAAEDEQRERTRRDTQLKNRISDLEEEDSAYTSKAKAAATRIEEIDQQIATQTDYYKRIDGSTEIGKKGQAEILERLKALRKAREATAEEKKTFEEEAAYRQRQIEVLQQQRRQYQSLGSSAAVVADARWREKAAEQQRDQDDLDQRLERRRSEEAWKREFKEAGQKDQQQKPPAEPKKPEPPQEPKKPEPPQEPKKPEPPQDPKKPEPPQEPKKPEPPQEPKKPEPPQEPKKPEPPQEPKKPEPPQEPKKPEPPQEPKKPEPPQEPKKPEPPQEPKKPEPPQEPAKPEKPEERQLQMLQEREDRARTEMGELRKQYDAEMAKDVQSRDERLLDELKTGILDAQDRMFDARSQREDLTDKMAQDAQNRLDQYADRFAGAYEPGSNRLNAMGLGAGSGVARVQEQMASSLKELVRLGQQQIAEIKAGNIRAADNVAVYGD